MIGMCEVTCTQGEPGEVGGHVEEARGNSPKQELAVDPDRALV